MNAAGPLGRIMWFAILFMVVVAGLSVAKRWPKNGPATGSYRRPWDEPTTQRIDFDKSVRNYYDNYQRQVAPRK
jgi:hypothetical protein